MSFFSSLVRLLISSYRLFNLKDEVINLIIEVVKHINKLKKLIDVRFCFIFGIFEYNFV